MAYKGIQWVNLLHECTIPLACRQMWCMCSESWAPGVKKLIAYRANGAKLGTIFLDLYHRPGKYTGCALFTVVCGKELPDGSYRCPTVVLCCSLPDEHSQLPLDQVRVNPHATQTLPHKYCLAGRHACANRPLYSLL